MSTIIDTLVTNRSSPTDVYTAVDLNRVGAAQKYVQERLAEAGTDTLDIVGKTDWTDDDGNVPEAELERYLADIKTLVSAAQTTAKLPASMRRLTYQWANRIEAALRIADAAITARERIYLRAGMPWAVSNGPAWRFAN